MDQVLDQDKKSHLKPDELKKLMVEEGNVFCHFFTVYIVAAISWRAKHCSVLVGTP